jgi:hypothetical protein
MYKIGEESENQGRSNTKFISGGGGSRELGLHHEFVRSSQRLTARPSDGCNVRNSQIIKK